ncbi:MAG: NAD-dependent epimerase/dehydratase family protein [Planctomycetota bacterium]
MHVLVTGAAGFIGSHLTDRLLAEGAAVTGIDDFDPYYDRALKERNLEGARAQRGFRFVEADINRADLDDVLRGVDRVVHLAAKAGVRGSWGTSFDSYLDANVRTTQRLLEACRRHPVGLFLYGGSASVYGDEALEPVDESYVGTPHSPYGLTKWAAERLAFTYRAVFGIPAAAARIFSCYGPRERPDKAIQIFLTAARDGQPITVHGDGSQLRDFTYVGDVVDGLVRALERRPDGAVFNLARGATRPLADVLGVIRSVTGRDLEVRYGPRQDGDVRVTAGVIERARALLGYDPRVDLEEGIARQWALVAGEQG